MKTVTIVVRTLVLMLLCAYIASADVTVTPASGGTGISGTKAQNGINPALRGFTTLGDITITEGRVDDFAQSQNNQTLILTAPANWVFNTGVGSVSFTAGRDITAASVAVTSTTITVTFSTANGNAGKDALDVMTISGIQVQAIDGQVLTVAHIFRLASNPGNGSIAGIVQDNGTGNGTNFGTLSSDGVLPVELVSFTGNAKGMAALLAWKTATEVNNYGFQIERREAGEWKNVGFVSGAGTSNAPREYVYTDQLGGAGTYAYRLKQIDKDGQFTYSPTIEVAVGLVAAEFRLNANYPNPFNPTTTLSFTVAQTGPATLKIFNILGEQVAVLFAGTAETGVLNRVVFNASALSSGIYFSVLESGPSRSIQKMVLAK